MARRAPLGKSKPCPAGSRGYRPGAVPWVGAQEWIVRDNFGERWRLRVVRAFDAIPPPAEDSNSYRYPINRLVYGAFDQFGARGEGDVARGLLEAYDVLTGASLSACVPNLGHRSPAAPLPLQRAPASDPAPGSRHRAARRRARRSEPVAFPRFAGAPGTRAACPGADRAGGALPRAPES